VRRIVRPASVSTAIRRRSLSASPSSPVPDLGDDEIPPARARPGDARLLLSLLLREPAPRQRWDEQIVLKVRNPDLNRAEQGRRMHCTAHQMIVPPAAFDPAELMLDAMRRSAPPRSASYNLARFVEARR